MPAQPQQHPPRNALPRDALRVARERLRFSFRALEDVTAIQYSRLQRIESGIDQPSTLEKRIIAAALHTPVAELFAEEEARRV